MKSGYRADVEAAECRAFLARWQVHARYFRQVIVNSGAEHLSAQVADGHKLKGDQEQYECPNERSSEPSIGATAS